MFQKLTSLVLAVTLLSLPGYLEAVAPEAAAATPTTYESINELPQDEVPEEVQIIRAVRVAVAKIQSSNELPQDEIPAAEETVPEETAETADTDASLIFEKDEDGSKLNLKAQEVPEETIALLAKVTMAEAEGESELGKRLVIDTILNRVDDSRFPNSIYDVIYQSGQFVCITNGRFDNCWADESICELVREELNCRTNSQVLYFSAGGYSAYGTPLLREGNHCFSG